MGDPHITVHHLVTRPCHVAISSSATFCASASADGFGADRAACCHGSRPRAARVASAIARTSRRTTPCDAREQSPERAETRVARSDRESEGSRCPDPCGQRALFPVGCGEKTYKSVSEVRCCDYRIDDDVRFNTAIHRGALLAGAGPQWSKISFRFVQYSFQRRC